MDQDDAPDVFTDGFQINVSPYAVILSFTKAAPGQTVGTAPTRVVNVRTSLEHAKVMAIVLRKQLKMYEESLGTQIPLHQQVWQNLGLSKQDDW